MRSVMRDDDIEIKKILSNMTFKDEQSKMLKVILGGGSMADASGKKSKQWAQSFMSSLASKIWG